MVEGDVKVEMPNSVSVVIRCKNEVDTVNATLNMLSRQHYHGTVELIVIDSGSTDGSLEMIKKKNPDVLHCIQPEDYVPGRVINWAMAHAANDWVIFLNADATPYDENWLENLLLTGTYTPNFGAAFCRQLCRKNSKAVFELDYDKCFGRQRQSVHWEHFFSMVGSLVYKPVWKIFPFKENLQYAEDDEWSRRLKGHGLRVVYAEDALVYHSHNYSISESYKRAKGDMKASTIAGTVSPSSLNIITVIASAVITWLKDIPFHIRRGRIEELPFSCATRLAQKIGRWSGNRL